MENVGISTSLSVICEDDDPEALNLYVVKRDFSTNAIPDQCISSELFHGLKWYIDLR